MVTSIALRDRRNVRLLFATSLILAMLSFVVPARAAPYEPKVPAQNPDLDASCGLDVLMILDESGSIAQSNATDEVQEAFTAFVEALANTGSRVAVVEFSREARLAVDSYVTVTTQTLGTTFLPYINNSYRPDGNTNWEDAFRAGRYFLPRPGVDKPHLVIMITDGDPTQAIDWEDTTYSPGATNFAFDEYEHKIPLDDDETEGIDSNPGKDRAVPNANGIKFQGSHILTVGIGNALNNSNSQQRLEDISGPDIFDGSAALDISTDDLALVPDFDDLADALREAAFGLCAPSITVQKLADNTPDPGTDDAFPVAAWDVTASVTAPGGITDWIIPPGATGDTATQPTDGAGFATFQWEPGAAGAAQVTVTEQDPAPFGYALDPDSSVCTFRTADAPADQPVPGFADEALGFSFTVPFESIVTCQMVNRTPPEPAIEILKFTNGANANTPALAPFIPTGDPVVWEYQVFNTGNVTLDGVTVNDDQTGAVGTCPQDILAPGESMVCEVTGTAAATAGLPDGVYANVGSVSAEDPFGTVVSGDDPSHYESADSDIRVVKRILTPATLGGAPTQSFDANRLSDAPMVAVGETVDYEFDVTNVGTEDLSSFAVTDPLVGPITCPAPPLAIGATVTCTADNPAVSVAGLNPNIALATGTGSISGNISIDTDPAIYFGSAPAVELEKSTNRVDADTPAEAPQIPVAGRVVWIYELTNTGNVPLETFSLTDDPEGAPNCAKTSIPVGATIYCFLIGTAVFTGDMPDGVYANNATVSSSANVHTVLGGDPITQDVPDADPSHYQGTEPRIDIEKSTNGEDADLPTGPLLVPGSTVTWDYVVTNTGNVTLDGVAVLDPVLRSVVCTLNDFAPGEQTSCQATGTAAEGQYVNGGIAVGVTLNPQLVAAADLSHYLGASGTINLEKHTNGIDADTVEESPYVDIGNEVTWSYVVRNEGNTTMTGIAVTDDQLGAITCPSDTLAVAQEMTCIATGTAEQGIYENTATVTGVDGAGVSHSDTDPSHYRGVEPGIFVEKLTNGQDADEPPGVQVGQEDEVVWTYQVTTGGHPTADVTIVDDDLGVEPVFISGDDNDNGILELGEVWVYEATGSADQAQYTNIATVDGFDVIDERAVTDTDPSNYQMVISVTGGDFSLAPYAVGVILVGLGLLLGIRIRHRRT
jgi:uncharacterized repeat protein (TIGR01451 family)